MNFWTAFNTYFPMVLGGVLAVEGAIQAQPGATKKQVVINSILAVAKVEEQAQQPQVAAISSMVDAVVTSFNAAGIFTHTPK